MRTMSAETLDQPQVALGLVAVALHAHGLDQADVQLARDDRRRHKAAARHRHDRLERPGGREPPRQRARVAMKLVP